MCVLGSREIVDVDLVIGGYPDCEVEDFAGDGEVSDSQVGNNTTNDSSMVMNGGVDISGIVDLWVSDMVVVIHTMDLIEVDSVCDSVREYDI